MHPTTWLTLLLATCCFFLLVAAESAQNAKDSASLINRFGEDSQNEVHVREKRTLFLKKKLLGAGLLGFGLGLIKGHKSAAYHIAPKVHHVYLSPPPSAPAVKYVEYVSGSSPYVESTVIHKISPFDSSW